MFDLLLQSSARDKAVLDERNPRSMLLLYTTLCHQRTVPLKLLEVLRQGDR